MTEARAALEPSIAGPLSHLRILEIAELVAGPFAGRLLHDLGAAVTKVERPRSGDASRHAGPYANDEPDPEASGLYSYFNRGKRSITLDWTAPSGRALLERLLDHTDVLIVDDRFGAGYEELIALTEEHDALSVVSITPFGLVGPRAHWRGSAATVSAYGGLTLYFGEQDRAPIPPPEELALTQGGLAVAIATLLSVLARGGSLGRGQVADISITDVLSSVHTGPGGDALGVRQPPVPAPRPPCAGRALPERHAALQGRLLPRARDGAKGVARPPGDDGQPRLG